MSSLILSSFARASSVEDISPDDISKAIGSRNSDIHSDKCVFIPLLPETTGRDGTGVLSAGDHSLWSFISNTISGTSTVDPNMFLFIRLGSLSLLYPTIFSNLHICELILNWRYLISFQSVSRSLQVCEWPDSKYCCLFSNANLELLSVDVIKISYFFTLLLNDSTPFVRFLSNLFLPIYLLIDFIIFCSFYFLIFKKAFVYARFLISYNLIGGEYNFIM